MKTTRGLICIAALTMLVTSPVWSLAADKTGAAERGKPEGKGFGGALMAELEKLDLTADQSQQIASIVKLNREAMKEARSEWSEARAALERQIQNTVFDEQAVRSACRKVAASGEEFAVQRAKIASQVRAVLTSEQLAELDKLRAEARGKIGKRFAKEHGAPVGE
ncbi:MAG: Spy/CpxP family protein refolding chaperone [Lentisphaerae bacterium]|nr:Spy/CpxP family protein refolding chaperone [Lentisphaerota bacterium]